MTTLIYFCPQNKCIKSYSFCSIIVIIIFIMLLDHCEMLICDERNPDWNIGIMTYLFFRPPTTCFSILVHFICHHQLDLSVVVLLSNVLQFPYEYTREAPGMITCFSFFISTWYHLQIIQDLSCHPTSQVEMIPPISAFLPYLKLFLIH